MNRLTDRIPPTKNGKIIDGVTGNAVYPTAEFCECGDGITNAAAVIDKLAEYEDAQEQGLLIRLPCKVGDIVYIIHDNFIKEMRITYFCSATRAQHILFYAECTEQHEDCDCGNQSCCGIRFDDYNMAERHIYLTREAAESALREITGKGGANDG